MDTARFYRWLAAGLVLVLAIGISAIVITSRRQARAAYLDQVER